MAFRTWAKLLSATLGVAALAGASQLGLAYGLGIVRLTRVLDVTTRDQWTAQLAWIAWFAMTAAVAGALAGVVLLRRWSPGPARLGVGTELALSFAAAIGAGVVVPLTMQPARTAQVAGVDEVVVIAICAGLGALVGIFAAWAALAQAVARWSVVVTGIAVWVIAVVSVAPSLAPSDPLPAVRLGVYDAGFLPPSVTQRTALATMPALALLIGVVLGWIARRRELPTLTIALAGLAGPALLTLAYLIAGPGEGDDRYQVVPFWAAMTAAGAGVLGSVLAAVLRRGPDPDEDEADDPGQDKPPLPKRTGRSESEIAAAGGSSDSPAPPAVSDGGDGPPRPAKTAAGKPSGGRTGGTPAPGTEPAAGPQAGPPGPRPASASGRGGGTSTPGPGGPPTARLGGPQSTTPGRKPEKPRRRGRRANVADAFIGRPQTAGVAVGEYATGEPAPFDAFARGEQNTVGQHRSPDAPRSPAADPRPRGGASPEPEPYVPEPATRPLPPEALQAPAAGRTRAAGGRLGRSLRPAARGRTAGPLTPEPTAISAPLPQPDPISAPLPVTPAPRRRPGDVGPDGKPRHRKDSDYVDWVSGLGE
ncbi:hypothetical protein [Actinoplanes sp. NPDC049118]|uniref:hypothetical protein n=1 Tax=Actinoplanes sp. NPDC049118 TaxID=3155769 RepID=UPI0034037484